MSDDLSLRTKGVIFFGVIGLIAAFSLGLPHCAARLSSADMIRDVDLVERPDGAELILVTALILPGGMGGSSWVFRADRLSAKTGARVSRARLYGDACAPVADDKLWCSLLGGGVELRDLDTLEVVQSASRIAERNPSLAAARFSGDPKLIEGGRVVVHLDSDQSFSLDPRTLEAAPTVLEDGWAFTMPPRERPSWLDAPSGRVRLGPKRRRLLLDGAPFAPDVNLIAAELLPDRISERFFVLSRSSLNRRDSNHIVTAVSPAGELLWQVPIEAGSLVWTRVVDQMLILVFSGSGSVVIAIDGASGALLWHYEA